MLRLERPRKQCNHPAQGAYERDAKPGASACGDCSTCCSSTRPDPLKTVLIMAACADVALARTLLYDPRPLSRQIRPSGAAMLHASSGGTRNAHHPRCPRLFEAARAQNTSWTWLLIEPGGASAYSSCWNGSRTSTSPVASRIAVGAAAGRLRWRGTAPTRRFPRRCSPAAPHGKAVFPRRKALLCGAREPAVPCGLTCIGMWAAAEPATSRSDQTVAKASICTVERRALLQRRKRKSAVPCGSGVITSVNTCTARVCRRIPSSIRAFSARASSWFCLRGASVR